MRRAGHRASWEWSDARFFTTAFGVVLLVVLLTVALSTAAIRAKESPRRTDAAGVAAGSLP